MAEELRAIANKLTDTQREEYLAKAMQLIYRSRAEKVSARAGVYKSTRFLRIREMAECGIPRLPRRSCQMAGIIG